MAKRLPKNPEKYCKVAWNSLRANRSLWGEPDAYRPITRIMYDQVFCSGYDFSLGLTSKRYHNAPMKNKSGKKKAVTSDHYLSPQFVGRMIMDNQERFLDNYESFKEIFYLSRKVINVTSGENKALSGLTSNGGGDPSQYKVYAPTNKKYEKIGIELFYEEPESGLLLEGKVSAAFDHPIVMELLEYEKRFLSQMPIDASLKLENKTKSHELEKVRYQ